MNGDPRGAGLATAAALALGAAVSLGLARFAYALLLPPIRADLGWSYTTAGAMNTLNAAGYLIGALAHIDLRRLFLGGCLGTVLTLALHGAVTGDAALVLLRLLSGVTSAATFATDGLLAARIGGTRAGMVLGIYYGGTGVGIVASALLAPPLAARAVAHAWQGAWWALAAAALLATSVVAATTRALAAPPAAGRGASRCAGRPSASAWPAGIAAYTIVFAAGQIVGPTFTGWIADGSGGLAGGLAVSALLLAVGAVLAALQRPLSPERP